MRAMPPSSARSGPVVTEAAFRKLALSFRGAEERSHMRHPDFRVGNRIFATMGYPRAGWAMVKLSPEAQAAFVKVKPDAFVPVKDAWGEQGCTNVILKSATAPAVKAALASAYQAQAAKARAAAPGRRRRATR